MPIDPRYGFSKACSGDNPSEAVSTDIDFRDSPDGFSMKSAILPSLSVLSIPSSGASTGVTG